MPKPEPLRYGHYYHVYNRGNGGETLFREERNYSYFLRLYGMYVELIAETFAYCLMPNHFHFLVRIKDNSDLHSFAKHPGAQAEGAEDSRSSTASSAFAVLFGTYTKAFNKAYQRTGSLFEKPFRRILVDSNQYCARLVAYIHRNPQEHGFVEDFRIWPFSSYRATLSEKPTRIRRDAVLDWFEGRASFEASHSSSIQEWGIEPLIADDFV